MKKKSIAIGAVTTLATGAMILSLGGDTVPADIVYSTVPANYALIDEKGIVKTVIVADEAFIQSGVVGDPTKWILTDYSNPDKAAAYGGKYDVKSGEFISKEDVQKYGDTVEKTDVIKDTPVTTIATPTP